MASNNSAELAELFSRNGTSQLAPDVLIELESMVSLYGLSPQDLFYKWEVYSIRQGLGDGPISLAAVQELKKEIRNAIEKESRAKSRDVGSRVAELRTPMAVRASRGGDVYGMLDELSPAVDRLPSGLKRRSNFPTPIAKTPRSAHAAFPRPTNDNMAPIPMGDLSFEKRPNAGKIKDTLNGHLQPAPAGATAASLQRIKLKAYTELSKMGYKTMSMKLSESANILDDRIDEFAAIIQQHYRLDDDDFGNPATQSPNEITVVGRIVSDSPVNPKLTEKSLMLETSRLTGAGMRVPLDVSQLNGLYDFFPGKIVALKGTNASGEFFSVREILPIPPMLAASSHPDEIAAFLSNMAAAASSPSPSNPESIKPLNIMVASGPYTPAATLDFAPFHALLRTARASGADCLVLHGPFIDIDHPLIRTGDFDFPPDYPPLLANPDAALTLADLFRYHIAGPLGQLAADVPALSIVLCPSVRDAVSKHVCWPQERLPRKDLGLPKQAVPVPNPVTLGLNETVFGLSSLDALDAVRLTECVGEQVRPGGAGAGAGAENVFARMARQVVEQRHFFPVFPPPGAYGTEFNAQPAADDMGSLRFQKSGPILDTGYLKLGEWTNVKPDVLVSPSAVVPPFVKVVEDVVVINPGPASKNKGAGTYARMTIYPYELSEEEKQAPDEALTHRIYERARVDIIHV